MKTTNLLVPFILLFCFTTPVFSQGVAINENSTPANSNAILDISSGTKGVLIPRMSSAERETLGGLTPIEGLLVYDSDSSAFFYYNNDWIRLAAGGIITHSGSVVCTQPLVLEGSAIVYNDLRIPATTAKSGGSGVPPFGPVTGLGNIYQHFFQDISVVGNEQSLYFNVQMPHDWKVGSAVYPHVHWMPSNAGTGTVRWGLEYTWVNIDGTFGPSTTIYGEEAISNQQNKHIMSALNSAAMNYTAKGASSMILCRIFRNSSNALDNYTGDAILMEFDLHYQMDRLGDHFTP